MKKSLLALAVVFASSAATAATVYDKDGTSLAVGGRVQAVVYNGNNGKIADHDAGLVNSARMNIEGKTKVNDYLSVFAFSEWDMADGNKSATGDSISTRDQYVGADFGSFGTLTAGKQFDAFYSVQEATDIFEDYGARLQGDTNAERRTGVFAYTYDNNGVFAKLGYQTAADDVSVNGSKANVEGGYSFALGYTLDDVVFGPLSFKAGYGYILGQDDKDEFGVASMKSFDNFKTVGASISWGTTDSGLYLAALYEQNRQKLKEFGTNSSVTNITNGVELVAGYTFDNGLGVFTGYDVANYKVKFAGVKGDKAVYRRVPVYVNYNVCDNFNVWAEAEFDANSSIHSSSKKADLETGTLLAAGARYTF